jgi:hypothetical protein
MVVALMLFMVVFLNLWVRGIAEPAPRFVSPPRFFGCWRNEMSGPSTKEQQPAGQGTDILCEEISAAPIKEFGRLAPQRSKGLVPLVSGHKLRRTATEKRGRPQAGT